MRGFNFSLKSSAEGKLSLRKRATGLRASAERLFGRSPDQNGADQSRRMVVAGSMAAAIAAPLPILAGAVLPASASAPHPDQALFDAEAAYNAAVLAEQEAGTAYRAAYRAYKAALGDMPAELVFPAWAASAVAHPGMPLGKYRVERRMIDPSDGRAAYRWTANGLRTAIAALPKAFGPAGRTPKLIRDLRALIPVAEAYEAREAELQAFYGVPAARAAEKKAREARYLAEHTLQETVAVTPAGLAVKVRQAVQADWRRSGGSMASLMRSAAVVSGVAIPEPESDPAGWLRAWEAIGGRVMPTPLGLPLDVIAPPAGTAAEAAEERRLFTDFLRHRDAITRYVRSQG